MVGSGRETGTLRQSADQLAWEKRGMPDGQAGWRPSEVQFWCVPETQEHQRQLIGP